MRGIQLAPNLRFLPLNDDDGDFGIVISHDRERVHNIYEVHSEEELRAFIAEVV